MVMTINDWLNKPNALREISDEEFQEILSVLAAQLAEVDYHYNYSEVELRQDWKKLLQYNKNDLITAAQVRPGMKLCEHFFPNFFDIVNSKGDGFKKYWNARDLEKVIKWNRSSHSTPYLSEMRRGISFCYGLTKNTMYRPHLAKTIVSHFKAKSVFDPCCGWGGRMLGTVAAGAKYVGCEPNTETYEHLCELAKFLEIEDKVKLYNCGWEEHNDSAKYDLVLTSPPYYNLEIYCNEATQCENQYFSYADWRDNWFLPMIRKSEEYANIICWNVADVGKITLQKDLLAFVGGQEEWEEGPLFGIGSSARQANQNELKNKKNLDKTFSFMRII